MLINLKLPSSFNVDHFIWMCIGIIIIWLFWSAAIVGIEIGDGYLTISSTQHLMGLHDGYGFQRGPFLPVYLLPAEWLSNYLNLHPLDVRIHHVFTAFLHSLYIVFCWLLLKQYYNKPDWLVAISFLSTITSFIFFSYAIFISPDIFPGLILILMILLVVKYEKKPQLSTWVLLIIAGFLAVSVKQTYAIFWAAILPACWFFYSRKINLQLFMAAILSAVLSWIAYAWFIYDALPAGTAWLKGPIIQIAFIKDQYSKYGNEDLGDIFIWWLYLRNFYNYGIISSILIIPAVLYTLVYLKTLDKTLKIMAIVWIFCFIFMNFTSFKEVRYLAFLAPLSVFLLVPFFTFLNTSKYRHAFILLLTISSIFDISRNVNEALRVNQSFYQEMMISYLKPLDDLISGATFFNEKKPKVAMINHLGFSPNLFSPLKGDRYHRTFHISNNVLPLLYNMKYTDFSAYSVSDNLNYEFFSPGDVIIFSNKNPLREPPWDTFNNATPDENYSQIIGVAEEFTLVKKGTTFHLLSKQDDQRPVLLLNNKNNKFKVMLGYKSFDTNELATLFGKNIVKQRTIDITGFRIRRSCNNNGCFDMDRNAKPMY